MKKVHIISVGGAIMHNIAIQLDRKGYRVTGSDDLLFDPSLSRLKEAGLLPERTGWDPERITADLDFVIAGMHARKDNPELKKAEELGLKIYSFPSFIRSQAEDQIRIVVAGSHGKTTTSSMIYHILSEKGLRADHLIGAQTEGMKDVVTFDGHPYFIIEGDEYPSSAIDPRPKFLHYDPDFLIITGIAWDHMNVFPTYESYFDSFVSLLRGLRTGCRVIYNAGDNEVVRLIEECRPENSSPYSVLPYEVRDGRFVVEKNHPLEIIGRHNIENLTAATELCLSLGLEREKILTAAESFTGAAKRLQLLHDSPHGRIYQDFAHAPSKVRASVGAVYDSDPERPLTAVLELHTYSSLNKEFLPQYRHSLDRAEHAVVMFDPKIVANKKMTPLDEKAIRRAFDREDIIIVQSRENLIDTLEEIVGERHGRMNLLMMSSGSFGGLDLKKKLPELWDK